MKDYYYILGVKPTSTTLQIKTAYRKLSKKLHPDLNQGDIFFEEQFKEIQEAYEVLCDDLKRTHYDDRRNTNKSINDESPKQTDDTPKKAHTSKSHTTRQNIKKHGIKDLLYQVRLVSEGNNFQFSIAFIITFIVISLILFITAHFNGSLNISKIFIYPPISFFVGYIVSKALEKLQESKIHNKDYQR